MRLNIFSYQNKYFNTEVTSLPTREEIEEKYKWNLSDIYNSDEEWERDFKWVSDRIQEYSNYIGTLSKDADSLYECLKSMKKPRRNWKDCIFILCFHTMVIWVLLNTRLWMIG